MYVHCTLDVYCMRVTADCYEVNGDKGTCVPVGGEEELEGQEIGGTVQA